MASQQSLSFRGALSDGYQPTANKGTFDFLGLSRELRDAIYELVLKDDCPKLKVKLCDINRHKPEDMHIDEFYRDRHSLLYLNRQVHEEYLQRAMQVVTFIVPFSIFDTDLNKDGEQKEETWTMPPYFAKNLKCLTFQIMGNDLRWSRGEVHGNTEKSTMYAHQAFLVKAEELLKTLSLTTLRFVMEYTMFLSNAIAETRIFLNRAENFYKVEKTELILACPGAKKYKPENWVQFGDVHTAVLKLRGITFERALDQDREILATVSNPPDSYVTEWSEF